MSSTSASGWAGSTNDTTSIEQKIKELQEEIKEVNKSDLDTQAKAEKIADLQKQIQLLQIQLIQKQSQQTQSSQSSTQSSTANSGLDALA